MVIAILFLVSINSSGRAHANEIFLLKKFIRALLLLPRRSFRRSLHLIYMVSHCARINVYSSSLKIMCFLFGTEMYTSSPALRFRLLTIF